MPELTATSILDPWVEGWAKQAGMPTEQLSSIVGGDIIGGLASVPMDLFLTQLGSKLASGAIGVAGLLFGTYTLTGKGRTQVDTMQISSRILTEILDPSPQQIREIQRNISDLIDGFVQGRIDKVAYALIRNPREMTGLLPQPGAAPQKKETPASTEKPAQPAQSKQTGIVMKL